MEIQKIADTLIQWGPAGAAAILIIVAENKLRHRWEVAKGNDRKMCAWLYTGNWLFIAALLSVVSIFWIIDKNRTNITMAGIVQDLRPPYKINDPTKELFTKTKLKSNWLYDVHWHYTKIEFPEQLEIRLENKSDFYDYHIPTENINNFLSIHILYKEGKLWLKSCERLLELKAVNSASHDLKEPETENDTAKFSFIREAHATEPVDINLILGALESDDSYIRQSASYYVVDNIEKLCPWIEAQLLSKETSALIRTGLVTALARASFKDIREGKNWKISENAEKQIFYSIFSNDKVLAAQSLRYITRNPSDKHLEWLDNECSPQVLNDMRLGQYCAFVKLHLIYNFAIKAWSDSLDRPIDYAMGRMLKAIKILGQNDGLWEHASDETKIQFAKLFYGKAFLQHELSKLYMKKGMQSEKDSSQHKAIDFFKDMLAYLAGRNCAEYEYPHHLSQANCYIQDPSQACFDKYAP